MVSIIPANVFISSRSPLAPMLLLAPGCLFTKDTLYILTYLLSRDISIPSCTYIAVACESRLTTCSEPQRLKCLRGCVGECAACHAGDSGSNPAHVLFFVVFLPVSFSFIRPFKSVFRLFSNIKPFRLRFTLFSSFLPRIFHWT